MATVTRSDFSITSRVTANNAAGAGITINKSFSQDNKNGSSVIVPDKVLLIDKEVITSGTSLTVDVYDLGTLDVGAGAGDDNLGETHANTAVNSIIIQNDGDSAGTLRINQTVANSWSGLLGGSNQIDLPAGGFFALSYGATGSAVTDASSHVIQLDAVSGDVTATLIFVAN